jgi:hypothetical protein
MGTVAKYPQRPRTVRDEHSIADQPWSATVIILPILQIERHHEMPSEHSSKTRLSGNPRQRTAPA